MVMCIDIAYFRLTFIWTNTILFKVAFVVDMENEIAIVASIAFMRAEVLFPFIHGDRRRMDNPTRYSASP